MPSTLQNGLGDLTAVLVAGTGSLIWAGRRGTSWSVARTHDADDSGQFPDDASLAERSRVDADAFGELYDRYCDRIYRYVYRRLNDHEAAEDVTAEIFLKVLRAIDTYRPATAPFAAWLFRIAANAVVDHARSRRITISLDLAVDAADLGAPVDELAINRVEAARVWQAIDTLTAAQRTAVILRFGRDLPIADIARRMGRTEGAVKLLLNRALAAVRTHLEDRP